MQDMTAAGSCAGAASCQCLAKVTVEENDTILVGTVSGWQPAKVLSKAPEDDTLDLAFPSGASPRGSWRQSNEVINYE